MEIYLYDEYLKLFIVLTLILSLMIFSGAYYHHAHENPDHELHKSKKKVHQHIFRVFFYFFSIIIIIFLSAIFYFVINF